jgi:hypothetical protein
MVDSFLFGDFPPGRRIAARRPSSAYFEYQITAAGKRQEKIKNEMKYVE